MASKRTRTALSGRLKVNIPTGAPADAPIKVKGAARGLLNTTQLSRQLAETQARYALTTEELAELISAYTREEVSRTTVSGWLRGAEPRMGSGTVAMALRRIDHEEGKKQTARWVPAEAVRKQMAVWLRTLTRKQIQLAGELPQSTQQAMEAGLVRCETRRWKRICALVEMWRDVAVKTGHLKKPKG